MKAGLLPSFRSLIGAVPATLVLISASGCTINNSTEETMTLAPLDEAAMIRLKQMTADVARDAFDHLSIGGADERSAVGSWVTCADVDPSFSQFNVTGEVTIPAGDPVLQLDPLVSALESDGWIAKRQTAPKGMRSPTCASPNPYFTADGSVNLRVYLIRPCVRSDLIGTNGYRFSIDHTPIDVR